MKAPAAIIEKRRRELKVPAATIEKRRRWLRVPVATIGRFVVFLTSSSSSWLSV